MGTKTQNIKHLQNGTTGLLRSSQGGHRSASLVAASAIVLWASSFLLGCALTGSGNNLQPQSALTITTSALSGAQMQSSYQAALNASGGSTPYRWTVASGMLPPGLSLTSATGNISGIATQAGSFPFTVQVQDSSSPLKAAKQNYTIAVAKPGSNLSITTNSMPSGMVGTPYSMTFSASGGTSPYTWSITSGSLPKGLSLNSSTGQAAGTPSVAGTSAFTMQVSDSAQNTAQAAFAVAISARTGGQALTITTAALPNGQVSKPYSTTLKAANGKTPYAWGLASGSGQLPSGLSLDASTGTISGTPTSGSTDVFTIQVSDSSSPVQNATHTYAMTPTTTGGTGGLDQYGGDANHACSSAATGYFFVYKDTSDNRWWFCDPDGNRFFMLAVQVVDEGDAAGYSQVLKNKYGDDHYQGFSQLLRRLNAYGFNTVGDDSSWFSLPITTPAGPGNPVQQPFIWQIHPSDGFKNSQFPFKDVVSLTSDAYTGFRVDSYPDVFDPNYVNYANSIGPGPSPWGGSQPFSSFSALDASPWLLGVNLDDGDRTWGFKNGTPVSSGVGPHTAWLVAADAPYQIYTGRWEILYSDPVMHTKAALATWLQQTADNGPGYTSIAALNAGWGANYSSFGTSGVTVTGETVGTGDGSTSTFTHTLKHTVVDPWSLALVVGSSTVSGDCPWFDNVGWELHSDNDCGVGIAPGTGVLGTPTGSTVSGGAVDYKTGALTVHFSTPPAPGQLITVNYIYGGWPHALTGGTGLLDEDGTNTWFPSDFHLPDLGLPNPPQVDTDLDNFLGHIAGQYFSTLSSAIRAQVPHHLVFTQEFLGAYDRPTIFQHAGKYVDALVVQDVDTPSLLGKVYQYSNKPLFLDERFIANPDSPFSVFACDSVDNPSYTCQPTQAARGVAYANQMNTDLALAGSDGFGFIIGWDYWEMTDKTSEHQNFGLFSPLDNAYDGMEDLTGPQPCFPEITLPGYVCGGETANHGDFLSNVTIANKAWLKLF